MVMNNTTSRSESWGGMLARLLVLPPPPVRNLVPRFEIFSEHMGRWWIQSCLYFSWVTSTIASTAFGSTILLLSDYSQEPMFSALDIMRWYGFSSANITRPCNKDTHVRLFLD
jgi:hypothetical protein